MKCKRCNIEMPGGATFCYNCGRKLISEKKKRTRANGEGSVYVLPNGVIRAVKTLGYETYIVDGKPKKRRKVSSKEGFKTKREANEWLSQNKKKREKRIQFKKLYDAWAATHKAGKSTMGCYSAAMNYFKPLWYTDAADIDIDDLQECIDECDKGKRTRQNMKTVVGLIYKYGIPRSYFPLQLNLAEYLNVGGGEQRTKAGFTDDQLEKIKNGIGKVPYADWIYALCYLGFRPSEFLDLDARNYERKEKAFIGGGKTEAGTDRTVTVSPKIQSIVDKYTRDKISGPVFCKPDGSAFSLKEFREDCFYPALEALGIENPITIINGKEFHELTPHSCRHTFATLLKRVEGAEKDKLELIGHTSAEMLRYYQDISYSDLRKITDAM